MEKKKKSKMEEKIRRFEEDKTPKKQKMKQKNLESTKKTPGSIQKRRQKEERSKLFSSFLPHGRGPWGKLEKRQEGKMTSMMGLWLGAVSSCTKLRNLFEKENLENINGRQKQLIEGASPPSNKLLMRGINNLTNLNAVQDQLALPSVKQPSTRDVIGRAAALAGNTWIRHQSQGLTHGTPHVAGQGAQAAGGLALGHQNPNE